MSENAREQGVTDSLPPSCKCVKGAFKPADTNIPTRQELLELTEFPGSDSATTRCNL
jgi:hypothetical protein